MVAWAPRDLGAPRFLIAGKLCWNMAVPRPCLAGGSPTYQRLAEGVADQRIDLDPVEQRRDADAVMSLSGQQHVLRQAQDGQGCQGRRPRRRSWSSSRRAPFGRLRMRARWPDFDSPFGARPVLMDADDGFVDHAVFKILDSC